MCRIYANCSITLKEALPVLTGDYSSTYVRVLQYFRESTGNLAVFHHCRHYEGLRLLPSVCEQIIIQQALIIDLHIWRISLRVNK